MFINGREKVGITKIKNPKSFIDHSQTTDDVNEKLEDYNPIKERRVLIVFHDMMAYVESNKKVSPKVTELFSRGRKLNIALAFIPNSYFEVPKTIRLNAIHCFIMKITNKGERQQIASCHLPEADF